MSKRDEFIRAIRENRIDDAIKIAIEGKLPVDLAKITVSQWVHPIRKECELFALAAVAMVEKRLASAEWGWDQVTQSNSAKAAIALSQSYENNQLLREVLITSGDCEMAMVSLRRFPGVLDPMDLTAMVQAKMDVEVAVKMAQHQPPLISASVAIDLARITGHGPSVVRLAQSKLINPAKARRLVRRCLDANAAEDLMDLGIADAGWVNKIRAITGLAPLPE